MPRMLQSFLNVHRRFAPVAWLAAVFLLVSSATRVVLALGVEGLVASDWARLLLTGFGYDLVTLLYVAAPLVLWLAVVPVRWQAMRWHRALLMVFGWAALCALLFNAVAEWLFWEEFDSRFNFIAIDYLIYTREVVGNITESYAVKPILAAIAVTATVVTWATWPRTRRAGDHARRWPVVAVWAIAAVAATVLVDHSMKNRGVDRQVDELSGNGLYELVAAFRHNEIDYASFYLTLPPAQAFGGLRKELATPDAKFVSDDPQDITRDIASGRPEKRLNVVMVSMESMSADFLASFGNTAGLTPNLDRLGAEGMLFTRTYATGTRTVRGLEALSLSVPPTPGQSIVRRPKNEHLFSLASVFAERGYESKYVYGGYSYFDNMGAFFGANGYQVVDRTAIPAAKIHHETVWGVADEDLFTQAIAEMNATHASGKPFFVHIMTTSNHRPYTYPEGRIDIPSGTGRDGAVKYSDWAIGRFVEDARSQPWFADTLFVFVADHQASSAGKSGLPVERYRIPFIVYSPAHVKPQVVPRLMSQIDVAPTMLGLLDFSYRSRFLGWDVFRVDPSRDRAFISTYQELGFIDGGRLVSLRPRRQVSVTKVDVPDHDHDDDTDQDLINEAIAWYQSAGQLFRAGRMAALPLVRAGL